MLKDSADEVNRPGLTNLNYRTRIREPLVRDEKSGAGSTRPRHDYCTFTNTINSVYNASDSMNAKPISMAS